MISYWDATDLSEIRQIEGSDSAEMTALHISQDGGFFASGSADREVKLWHYNKGALCYVGAAHSGAVTALKKSKSENDFTRTEHKVCELENRLRRRHRNHNRN